jgi:hypothetical protein
MAFMILMDGSCMIDAICFGSLYPSLEEKMTLGSAHIFRLNKLSRRSGDKRHTYAIEGIS